MTTSGSEAGTPPAAPARLRIPPPCDVTLGLRCVDKSEPGVTVWEMDAEDRFANPAGSVQGGIISALADTAMSASTVTYTKDRKVLAANTDLQIRFLRAATVGQVLRCTARVIAGGRRTTFVEAEVRDSTGRLVAKASSTFLLTPRE